MAHIGIAAPIATADVAHWLRDVDLRGAPRGYAGAPLVATLIGELLRRGHTVSAVTTSSDMPLRSDARATLQGDRFSLTLCPQRPRAWPMNGWRLGRIVDLFAFERAQLTRALKSAGPDVIHAHWAYEFAWAAQSTSLPTVVTSHDSPIAVARFERDFRHGAYRWMRALMARHVLRRAPVVTTVSPYMVGQVQPLCGRAVVQVVPNPIEVVSAARGPHPGPLPHAGEGENQPPLPLAGEGRGEGATRLAMVGNGFQARKNPEAALRAFAQIASHRPDVEFHVFGHGFGRNDIAEQWWQASGLQGRIVFRGAVSHSALLHEIADCALLIHPALEESFGAVLAEAMAQGVPVIAGEASGAVPWVVGKAGRLIDVRDPTAIASAALALLGDPPERARLGELGRQRVRNAFNASVVVDAYERAYDQALATALPVRTFA